MKRCLAFAAFASVFGLSFSAQAALDKSTPLSAQSYGPIKIGMTLEEASKAAGVPILKDEGEEPSPSCFYANATRAGAAGVIFMVEKGTISAFTAPGENAPKVQEGVGVGSSADEVKKQFQGRYKVTPNNYGAPGDYNIVVEFPNGFGYNFIIDNKAGKVSFFHAGKSASVQYVEGCQ